MSNDFRANRVTRYRLTQNGSGYKSEFLGDMISSSHRGFRPVDIKMGPDGAIYIVDWYNLIIDHGEVDFHHPLRDKRHGRIWRLTAKNSPLVQPPDLATAGVPELLGALRAPEQWTRDQARRLLSERAADEVMPALQEWVQDKALSEHDRLEALWVCQGLRAAGGDLLRDCLRAEDHRVRAAAVRVLSDWSEQIADSIDLLRISVSDSHPQVRLEAVNALRHVGTREAVELAMHAIDQPIDTLLDFALFRTAHELRDLWVPDFQTGKRMFDGDPQRMAVALSAVANSVSLKPLADLVRKDRVRNEQLVDTLIVLAAMGDRGHRTLAVDRMLRLPAEEVCRVLTALVQSDRNNVRANASLLQTLFDSRDARVRRLAIELAGRWKLAETLIDLRQRASDATAPADERLVAGRAVIAIDSNEGSKTLADVYAEASSDEVRATTAVAWTSGSPANAAPPAVQLLASLQDLDAVTMIVDTFISQTSGPRQLTYALRGTRVPAENARRAIEQVRLSGQDMPQLIAALRLAGRLEPLAKSLAPEEIAAILRDASTQGDARRGEAIYRRERLQCATCHAVRGVGGEVGPDLSSLGASARLGDILQSLLNPSASIKEGYQTTHVITVAGRIVTGVLQQQTSTHLRIRDANNKLHTIPVDDIEETEPSQLSVMPTGLTEILGRDELIDLVRYLSTLGRENVQP